MSGFEGERAVKQILKTELKRAFTGKMFFISIGLGCILAILQLLLEVTGHLPYMANYFTYQKPMTGIDYFFSAWMGGNPTDIYGYIFFLLLPILAVLPYADTFYTDMKSGFVKNLLLRVKRRHYFFAKYIAAFLAGGAAVVIPLLLNFLSAAMVLPAILPQSTSGSHPIWITSMWHGLYYNHPFVYEFLYMGLDFLFAGIFAAVALSVTRLAQNRIITLLSPFILYIFLSAFFDFLGQYDWAPRAFLPPGSGSGHGPVVAVEAAVGFLLTFFVFVVRGPKDDVY